MDINERMDKFENRLEDLEKKINEAIPDIQAGIREIKVLIQERPKQEDLKLNLINKDFDGHEKRIKKLEDTQNWLWKTIIGAIITTVIGAIIFVIKMM